MKDLEKLLENILDERLVSIKNTLNAINSKYSTFESKHIDENGIESLNKSTKLVEHLLENKDQFWFLKLIFEELFEIDDVRSVVSDVKDLTTVTKYRDSECPICGASKYGTYFMEELDHDDDCAYLKAIKLKETLKKDK